MRVTVLGSGDAFSGCGCNAGYLVDTRVLIDCGAPVHVFAQRLEVSVSELRTVLLTHFHADHTFMLPMLLGSRAFPYRSDAALTIGGPVGIREYVDRLVEAGWGKHISDLLGERMDVSFAELQDGSDVRIGDYRVRAHAVIHSTGPSLAYAVSDADGTTVGFSGDSTHCAGLERVIDQSDLMVCECTAWDSSVAGGHLWSGQVQQLMRDHSATPFLLSHLSERRELPGALIAHDLLTLDVQPRPR